MSYQSRYIYALGLLFVAIAAGQAILEVAGDGAVLVAVLDFILISFPGLLFLYVGKWLSRTDLDPNFYPRIVGWCLGGVGVMFVFLVLRIFHPNVAASFTFGERAIALALGSVAGLGIGILEAQALTREQEGIQRNKELHRTQEQLEDANRRLKTSNERLDHFASAASHDLQEPLRMISRYLQLLENRYADDLDDDAEEFIEFAVDGADRMQVMVNDLLEYSRIETRGNQFEPVDLEDALDDALTNLRVRIEETNAEITREPLPRIRGDASQLRQLFQNLLSNAIEYSGDAPPRIHVSAEEAGSERVISVRDEGIGIDPDNQQRIFEIFQRLHAVDEHAGSGIGLALCQRIVERHSGEIWVESAPREGSTFSFTIASDLETTLSAESGPKT